jgi:hypothetical protein
MKLAELAIKEKTPKPGKFKMIITESQFRALAQNVLNEQDFGTIKRTHLIKIK